MKRYSTSPKARGLDPHHPTQFSALIETLVEVRCLLIYIGVTGYILSPQPIWRVKETVVPIITNELEEILSEFESTEKISKRGRIEIIQTTL